MLRPFGVTLAAAMLVAGCATKGLLEGAEAFQITQVTVTKADPAIGTVNLSEEVRFRTLQEGSRYGQVGQPRTLRIDLRDLHLKNPMLSWAIGDSNRISATVALVDPATGHEQTRFDLVAIDSGYLQGIAGAVESIVDDPIDVEQRLALLLAEKSLERLHGTPRALEARQRPPAPSITANYPAPYEALKRERECSIKRRMADRDSAEDRGMHKVQVPAHCQG